VSRRQFLALIVPLLVVLLGFVALSVTERVGSIGVPPWDEGFSYYVRRTFAREYVGGVEDDQLNEQAYFNALNAYVRTFDAYAEIVPPWQLQASREQSSGNYAGIGIRIAPWTGEGPVESIRIVGICPGGPAELAGLRIGEDIVAVGGERLTSICPTADTTPLQFRIRGKRRTVVEITVRDQDGNERGVEVTRDEIPTGSVFGVRLVDEESAIGYVRISNFHITTAAVLKRKIQGLKKAGMKSLVLDLRFNSGGILPQAVDVTDLFIQRGVIVRVRGRDPALSQTFRAQPQGTCDRFPMVVLVNGHSASAAEIVAGALQDHRRALIVGERTYGKFLVQTVEELDSAFGSARFKRSTAIYETPHGHNYSRLGPDVDYDPMAGIAPDLLVFQPPGDLKLVPERFAQEELAEWNPDERIDYSAFHDEQLSAAVAVLRGEVYSPSILRVGEADGQ
jgi:carboxyl-terminal processing protease